MSLFSFGFSSSKRGATESLSETERQAQMRTVLQASQAPEPRSPLQRRGQKCFKYRGRATRSLNLGLPMMKPNQWSHDVPVLLGKQLRQQFYERLQGPTKE